jgi:iron complex transport system substrate-binding protein
LKRLLLGLLLVASSARAEGVRVATLAPSLTEIVLGLGQGDRLVGVSRYDDAAEVKALPHLGGVMDPSPEAILAVKPTVVVAQPNPANTEVLARLQALHVTVLQVQLGTLAQVEQAERDIAAALGVPEKGAALVAGLEKALADAKARAAGRARPRVLVVYGWEPLVVAGPGSFTDELVRAAGGDNAAASAKSAFAAYSVEAAAAAKPDVVLDASFAEVMPVRFATLPGLKDARRVKPSSLALLHPGPRLADALVELEALLHPNPAPGK